ncbi:hypothetical protein ENBRE01_1855 [Enteropsectra breve]|nr:hypothetical protein ENBRE01_1855 [Enteropsectra breve]
MVTHKKRNFIAKAASKYGQNLKYMASCAATISGFDLVNTKIHIRDSFLFCLLTTIQSTFVYTVMELINVGYKEIHYLNIAIVPLVLFIFSFTTMLLFSIATTQLFQLTYSHNFFGLFMSSTLFSPFLMIYACKHWMLHFAIHGVIILAMELYLYDALSKYMSPVSKERNVMIIAWGFFVHVVHSRLYSLLAGKVTEISTSE